MTYKKNIDSKFDDVKNYSGMKKLPGSTAETENSMTNLKVRAAYALRLVACLALFWEPFVYGTVTRQDWKDAVSHCWHVVRTGDVWSA